MHHVALVEDKFPEFVQGGFLEQYIEERIGDWAILHLALSNEKGLINNLAVKEPLENSDHNLIRVLH